MFAHAISSTGNMSVTWKDLGLPPKPKADKTYLKKPSRVLPGGFLLASFLLLDSDD